MPCSSASRRRSGCLGPSGVGKSHIATALALKVIERGHRAYFLSLHDFVTRSRVAREKNRLDVLLNVIKRSDLFILDEVGYLPLESADASLLFEVVSKRYELRKPIVLTSNTSYGQWGSSSTPSWQRRSWIASSTTPPPSTSGARATACGTAARAVFPGSLSKERSHAGTLNRTAAGVSNSKPSQLSTSYPALTQCQPHPLG